MAKSVNSVQLLGNIGSDPEVRTTQSGNKVANFSLATNESRKSGDGWEDFTEWHWVVMFGKQAEILEKYTKKGDKIHVTGRLSTRKWQDKNGNDKYTTEIIANDLVFCGGGSAGGGQQGGSSQPERQYSAPPSQISDDDIPF